MSRRFRILSLDGGGVRGAFTASFLASLERQSGKRIIDHFDLITGTSTGGLLAMGLALGHPAERIVRFYQEEGPRIFPTGGGARAWRWLRHWVAAKHRADVLAGILKELYGNETVLGAMQVPVVIPAFDVSTGKTVCFKTRHHAKFVTDHTRRAWEVGMATASAPTYFPPFRATWGSTYVDGGVWANRPSLVGLVEATRYFGVPAKDVQLLCVGTTGSAYRLKRLAVSGKLPWAARGDIFDVLMESSACAATFESTLLLEPGSFVEVNHDTGKRPLPMDDARFVDELRGLGEEAGKWRGAEIAEKFLDARVAPFTAVPLNVHVDVKRLANDLRATA